VHAAPKKELGEGAHAGARDTDEMHRALVARIQKAHVARILASVILSEGLSSRARRRMTTRQESSWQYPAPRWAGRDGALRRGAERVPPASRAPLAPFGRGARR